MDKKEIIANLYAIKTGMAAIAVQNDKLVEKQKVIDAQKEDYDKNLKDQGLMKEAIQSDDTIIKNNNNSIEDSKKHLAKEKEKIKKELDNDRDNANKAWKKASPTLLVFGVIAVVCIYALINYIKKMTGIGASVEDNYMELLLYAMGLAISIVLLIVVSQKAHKEAKAIRKSGNYRKNHYSKLAKENYDNSVNSAQDNLLKATENRTNHSNQLAELKQNQSVLEEKLEGAKKAYAMTEEIVLPVANAIYEATLTKYGEFLDEREWGIVDLLIYYFETGRADTLKEALLHADQQRALQKIVEAVLMANENICQTMDRSLRNLGDRLTTSIGLLHAEMMMQMDRVVASNAEMTKSINRTQAELVSEIKNSMESVSASINTSVNSLTSTVSSTSATQTDLMKKMRQDSNSLAQNVRYITTKKYGSAI